MTRDLDQGQLIAQRAFSVSPEADAEDHERVGQPPEASVLLEAVRLHLNDAVYTHHGRTELRDGVDGTDYPFDLPDECDEVVPDRPVDGLGKVARKRADSQDASN